MTRFEIAALALWPLLSLGASAAETEKPVEKTVTVLHMADTHAASWTTQSSRYSSITSGHMAWVKRHNHCNP